MAESQPTPVGDAIFSQELLGEFLVQQGLVSPDLIDEARALLASRAPTEPIPVGNAFVATADGKSLLVVDPRKGTVQQSVALFAGDPGDLQEAAPGWSRFCDGQIVVLDPEEHGVKRWLPTRQYERLGLIPTPKGAFLYTGEEPRREYSPSITSLPSAYTNPPGASGALDLYAAPGGEYVVAVNRGAGTVHVVLVNTLEQRGAFSVRPAGHAKGIGVAISQDGRTVYVSDGLTPRLAVLDVATFKVRHQLFPTGALGAMSMHPDGASLLVAFTKTAQEMGLMTLSLPDLRVRHLINLPGKGEGDRPNLPLVAGPDPNIAYLVAYSFETRDSQYLLSIDRAKHRVLKTFALKDMPLALGFPAPAAWCPEPPDLGDALVEMQVLTEENLRLARTQLRATGDEAPMTLGSVPINPAILAQLPERLIRDRGVIPLNQLDGQLIVAMANPRDPRARQFVQDLAGELTVRAIPMSPAEFELFLEERYPKLMEQFYASEGIVENPPAQAPAPTPTPPPRAAAPQPAPEPEAPRELTSTVPTTARPAPPPLPVLSIDEWGALAGNRFLMINPLKRQVAELDRTGKAAWLYSPEGDTLTRQMAGFVHAGRLANGNTLVVDLGGHRVLEVTPTKETVWQTADEAKLKGPRHAARLANGNTLVVDSGNNRIVEIDKAGRASWTYGEMGCSGNGLFKPGYALVLPTGRILIADTGNHRVIELDPARGVVWQYGNANNRLGAGQGAQANQVSEPSSATRLPNGNTLIADAGNQRVIEVDLLSAMVWQYRPAQVQGGRGVKDPILAKRLENGNTLIAGRQGICEVTPELSLVWEYHLMPPSGPVNPAVSARRAEAPSAVPEALRVAAESDVPVNLPGKFLQADRMAHRIWEIDREKEVVWQYTGLGTAGSDNTALDRPHYVRRLRNGNTLITDTGHHRVIEVSPQGTIAWQFGQRGKLGNGPKHLANPRSAERLTNGHTLIADQSNKRIIEVSMAGEIVWAFEGAAQRLQAPNYATMLTNGNLLIVDWGGHIVYEMTTKGRTVWSHGQFGASGSDHGLLFHPEYAYRLPNGHTMIADTQNHRLLEVTAAGEIAWQYGGSQAHLPRVGRFGMQFATPIAGWRLPNGNVVVQHAGKGHIVEVDKDLNILFQYAP